MTLQALLSSRVKAELLSLLFGPDSDELHVREIARRARLNDATVRQELKRFVSLGLVSIRRDGNRSRCSANRSHPCFVDLAGLVLKTTGVIPFLRQKLGTEGIRAAFIFGSFASGMAGPESDIDLMVIGSVSLRDLVRRFAGVTDRLGRLLNPHVIPEREVARRLAAGDHFLRTVWSSPRIFVSGAESELAGLGGQSMAETPPEQR